VRRPGFLPGVLLSAMFAVAAAAAFAVLSPFTGTVFAFRLIVAALGLVYAVYLLRKSAAAVGRVTVMSLWTAAALAAWWFHLPLPLYLTVHVLAVWLIRSLYFHSGLLPALADLALGAAGLVLSAWAASRTGSLLIATWSFFLVQALFASIPETVGSRCKAAPADESAGRRFERARREADRALKQLAIR